MVIRHSCFFFFLFNTVLCGIAFELLVQRRKSKKWRMKDWKKGMLKMGKRKGKEHLICNLSTLIFDHSEEEDHEMPHISNTGLLTLPHPAVARPFYCSVGLLNSYSAQWPGYFWFTVCVCHPPFYFTAGWDAAAGGYCKKPKVRPHSHWDETHTDSKAYTWSAYPTSVVILLCNFHTAGCFHQLSSAFSIIKFNLYYSSLTFAFIAISVHFS